METGTAILIVGVIALMIWSKGFRKVVFVCLALFLLVGFIHGSMTAIDKRSAEGTCSRDFNAPNYRPFCNESSKAKDQERWR